MKSPIHWIPRFYFQCIFLFAPLFTEAQNLNADSLFSEGDYLKARVEYEKSIFSGGSVNDINKLLLKKSYCFKEEGKFENAYQTLQRITVDFVNKDFATSILYELSLTAYLANKSDLALSHLEEMKYYFPDTTSQILQVLEVLSLNEVHQWNEAQQKFKLYATTYNLGLNEDIYSDIISFKPRNPRKAETMSMLFPGSGQMYTGHFLRGLSSTVINGGLVLFTLSSFSSGFYLSGAFTGVALFYLFYNGGVSYARSLAEKRNFQVYLKFNDSIKSQIWNGLELKK